MKRWLRSRGGPWRRRGPPQVRQGEGGEEEGLRQVQVPEGVQGLPPGGRVRAGVGHGEVARAV